MCSARVVCALAKKAQDNVSDRKKDLLQLYDALLISDTFANINENKFYELYNKVSTWFFIEFLIEEFFELRVFC